MILSLGTLVFVAPKTASPSLYMDCDVDNRYVLRLQKVTLGNGRSALVRSCVDTYVL